MVLKKLILLLVIIIGISGCGDGDDDDKNDGDQDPPQNNDGDNGNGGTPPSTYSISDFGIVNPVQGDYRIFRDINTSETSRLDVIGTEVIDGVTTYVIQDEEGNMQYQNVDEDGGKLYGVYYYNMDLIFEEALLVYPSTFQLNKTYTSSTKSVYLGMILPITINISAETIFKGIEDVELGDTIFQSMVAITEFDMSSTGFFEPTSFTYTSWFAPDLGEIKALYEDENGESGPAILEEARINGKYYEF